MVLRRGDPANNGGEMSLISLFSGAGFLDLGFVESGFRVDWASELVFEFARTYMYNMELRYGEKHEMIVRDVQEIVDDLGNEDTIPRTDGVIGGPPCQDFSIGNASSPGVEGNRGKLVWAYLKMIEHIRPKFFLFENVEAIRST